MSRMSRVIICDMSDIVRQGIAVVLQTFLSYTTVGEAATSLEAVQQAKDLDPDLIIMDLFGDLEPAASVRQIKEAVPNCKLIILTESDDISEIIDAMSAGADSYCLKNRPSNLFKHAVEATLDGANWLDPGVGVRLLRSHGFVNGVKSKGRSLAQAAKAEDRFRLSRREYDVLKLMAAGASNREIAGKLWISIETVKSHVSNIISKLEVSDRTSAALKALREQLIQLETAARN